MSEDVTLLLNGQVCSGWLEAHVNRSMDHLSASFSLKLYDKAGGAGRIFSVPVAPGTACTLMYGSSTLITGYVDAVDASIDATRCGLTVSGRDCCGDLSDCSALHNPDQWDGLTLDQIAGILCQPFGIQALAQAPCGAPFPTFKLQPGEDAFSAIERLARQRDILVASNAEGNLVLSAAGLGEAAAVLLEEGVNILSATLRDDYSKRFQNYRVKGQRSGPSFGGGASAMDLCAPTPGTADDADVKRHRPLLILDEIEAAGEAPDRRAAWEATVRAGRSRRVSVMVQGLRQTENGPLWMPNATVTVVAPSLGLNDNLLITSCDYSLTSGGARTTLRLAPLEAYQSMNSLPERGLGGGAA